MENHSYQLKYTSYASAAELNEEDAKLRVDIQKERARIIQKMLDEKKGGAPTQRPVMKRRQLFECDTMQEDYLEVAE